MSRYDSTGSTIQADGPVVKAPVSINDVKGVLNVDLNDLGTLCRANARINSWSIRKPLITSSSQNQTVYYINMETLTSQISDHTGSSFIPVSYFEDGIITFFNMILDCDPPVKYKDSSNNTVIWTNHPKNLNLYSRWYQHARNKSGSNYQPTFWKRYNDSNEYLNGYRLSDFNGYKHDESEYSWLQVGFSAKHKNSQRDETIWTEARTQAAIMNIDNNSINGTYSIGELRKCFGSDYGIKFYLYCFATDTFNGGTFNPKYMLYNMFKDTGNTSVYMVIDVMNISASVMDSASAPLYTGSDMWSLSNFFNNSFFVLNPYSAYSPSYCSPWSGGSNNDYGGTRTYVKRISKFIGTLNSSSTTLNIPINSDFEETYGDLCTKNFLKWSDILPDFRTGDSWNNLSQVSSSQYNELFEIAIGFYCLSGTASVDQNSIIYGNKPYHMVLPCRGNRIIVELDRNQR